MRNAASAPGTSSATIIFSFASMGIILVEPPRKLKWKVAGRFSAKTGCAFNPQTGALNSAQANEAVKKSRL